MSDLLLSVHDALITFGGAPLFEELSFNLHNQNRIALVGKNGAGKTTLMKIITGERELDSGEFWQAAGIVVGYMQQDVIPKPGQTVFEYIFEQIKDEDKEASSYRVDMVVEPLELDVNKVMTTMSGGQIRRAALARALVEDPDILLLDEPTNHLDLEAIEWLEGYLNGYRGTLLCVSHDRAFLANITNKVFWLDRGDIRVSPEGFRHFEEWSERLLAQEERELKNRKKQVEMEVEWANRGVKARRKRNVRRVAEMKKTREKLKQDQHSYNRAVSKIELPPPVDEAASSRIVAEFFKVHKSYDDLKILDGLNMRIMKGDRIGILGNNGSGKTTFLKLLIGEEKADQGKVKRSKTAEISYFDQKRSDLNPKETLWKSLIPTGSNYIDVNGKARHVCGYLKDLMFDPSRVHDKVETLSGGEKNRLILARVLADPGNFLILDEPTNDLDMDTLDMLEEILINYPGTLFIVSHDRDFLDQTVTRILAFEGNGDVKGYVGGYSDYLESKKKRERQNAKKDKADGAEEPKSKKSSSQKQPPAEQAQDNVKPDKVEKKLSYKLQFELDNLPEKISKYEQMIKDLAEELKDPEFYSRDPDAFQASAKKLEQTKEKLEKAEYRWLEIDEMRFSG
jgi:ATP-binding cassette subfamily F protein uup